MKNKDITKCTEGIPLFPEYTIKEFNCEIYGTYPNLITKIRKPLNGKWYFTQVYCSGFKLLNNGEVKLLTENELIKEMYLKVYQYGFYKLDEYDNITKEKFIRELDVDQTPEDERMFNLIDNLYNEK